MGNSYNSFHFILTYSLKLEGPCLTTFLNTKKRVEKTTRIGIFLTRNFEVFGSVVKHSLYNINKAKRAL